METYNYMFEVLNVYDNQSGKEGPIATINGRVGDVGTSLGRFRIGKERGTLSAYTIVGFDLGAKKQIDRRIAPDDPDIMLIGHTEKGELIRVIFSYEEAKRFEVKRVANVLTQVLGLAR